MNIFLPGTDQQLKQLFGSLSLNKCLVLVIGSGSEIIASELRNKFESSVILIVDENESLLISRIKLSNIKDIPVKLMEFTATDFKDSMFDLVYAQGSVSNNLRNKIVKEIMRILKPGGHLCLGEIVSLTGNQPDFIKDMFEASGISPLSAGQINDYYLKKGFDIILEKDLSFTLKDFYETGSRMLKEAERTLDDLEKSFYKKLIKKINHESNIFLRMGGDKYYGFKMLLLKKG